MPRLHRTLAGAPCRPREPIGCCGVKEPDLSPALDGVRHARGGTRIVPPEADLRHQSDAWPTDRDCMLPATSTVQDGRLHALDCTIEATTMARTGGGIQP